MQIYLPGKTFSPFSILAPPHPNPTPPTPRRRNLLPNINPSTFQAGVSALEIAFVHGWLALHFVFGDWQCPVGQLLEDPPPGPPHHRHPLPPYCLEVLRYWFPARARCLTCQSMVRTVGCHWEQAGDVWCLADVEPMAGNRAIGWWWLGAGGWGVAEDLTAGPRACPTLSSVRVERKNTIKVAFKRKEQRGT